MKLILKWDKIPSMNSMYVRTHTGIALSRHAREFKGELKKQLQGLNSVSEFNENDVFKLKADFNLKTRYFVRDVDNMLKLTIDAIFDELKINDSRILEMEVRKYLSKDSTESIEIELNKSTLDYDKTTVKK